MTLQRTLKPGLRKLLATSNVEVIEPRELMLELRSVPAGHGFSKPRTNLLFRERGGWDVFVDEDFAYEGDDPQRRVLFSGDCDNRWQALSLSGCSDHDLNSLVLHVLNMIESPIRNFYDAAGRGSCTDGVSAGDCVDSTGRGEPSTSNYLGRPFDIEDFAARCIRPTPLQAAAANCIVNIAGSSSTRACPVLVGKSGVGKSTVARLAASALVKHGRVRSVIEISAAAIWADTCTPADRNRQLREALESAADRGETLVILEQFDLLMLRSRITSGLLDYYLDSGLKIVGIAQAGFPPQQPLYSSAHGRRLQYVRLDAATPKETLPLLLGQMTRFQPSRRIEIAHEAMGAILALSVGTSEKNPSAALSLLESTVTYADLRGLALIGPDEVYHVHALNDWGAVTRDRG